MRNPFRKPDFVIEMTEEDRQSVREGKGRIVFLPEGCRILPPTGRDEALAHWQAAVGEQCALTRNAQTKNERVKALIFMRLNAARDAKDKKTIATLTEIKEAMR